MEELIISKEKQTLTYFYSGAIKIVVDCIRMVIEKFVNGNLCNTFYLDETYPPEQIPNYVRCISRYTHKQK